MTGTAIPKAGFAGVCKFLLSVAWVGRMGTYFSNWMTPRAAACLAGVIILLSVIDNLFIHYLDSDMSWLLVVADKMLSGERLYVDVWETNPPFSIFLYFPSAWLAQLSGTKAELWVGLSAYVWAFGCLGFAAAIAKRAELLQRRHASWLAPVALAVVFLSLPQAFAQREFYGALAALPMLTVAGVRDDGRKSVALPAAVTAGMLASVTMMVKPYYALAFLFPYLYLAVRARSPRKLFAPEVMAAAAVVIVYTGAVLALFPEFIRDVVPAVMDVYSWRSFGLVFLLLNSPALHALLFLGAYLFLLVRVRFEGLHAITSLSFLGFVTAFFLMGKGFPYHALPFFLTGAIAVTLAALDYPWGKADATAVTVLGVLTAAVVAAGLKTFERNAAGAEFVASLRAGRDRPSIAVIASNISVGSPFTRIAGGTWVGRDCSDWLGAYSLERLSWGVDDATERVRRHLDYALARKREEIVLHRPDILIIDWFDAPWVKLVIEDKWIKRELANYASVGRLGSYEYLRRK